VAISPLARAEIQIISASEPDASPVRIMGLAEERSMEVPPGESILLPADEAPTPAPTIFIPPPVGSPIRAELAFDKPIRLTERELADLEPGASLLLTTHATTVDLHALEPIAEQAADDGRRLIVVAGLPQK
jgi:hypothetical protein